ncbi:hypothetical protein CAEBREN_03340 [Caenorhabditis brenneri]|uniref:DUF7808 domain-containing protein n=1 Tax=Caenorhabditis brenneri TaxID=135651 RepID=G0NY90_CAEBE|nr:hypothetical protein CAEBREN_03340 [Caenorhabditis brenneri]
MGGNWGYPNKGTLSLTICQCGVRHVALFQNIHQVVQTVFSVLWVNCQLDDFAFVEEDVFISYIDQGHRACFNFITYQVEKRNDEHVLWRSGKCLNSTVNYRIGCKFDDPFETQFKSDNEIFAHLRARPRRV